MSSVLVVNSGSSSLKYQLIDMGTEQVLASGVLERIGEPVGSIRHENADGRTDAPAQFDDHEAAFQAMLDAFAEHGPSLVDSPPVAVGHRVVQGARRFFEPTVVDDTVMRDIEELSPLAPLHNPANLSGIRGARRVFPHLPHVAVFDTAFHTTMPDAASTYAIDKRTAEKFRVRRYGAHGTSHRFIARAAAEFLGKPLDQLRLISLHIGNGASACAINGGISVDTSMGLTPLEGLVMGTRSGDIDPAVLIHLHRQAGMDFDELDTLLNRKSGLYGLTGSGDVRDVTARAKAGDSLAKVALDVYAHRIRAYIGAYLAQLRGADAIVWTAGVGENSPEVRELTLAGMEPLGIELDPARNEAPERVARRIATDSSPIDVLVIPTNEELEIARQTLAAARIPATLPQLRRAPADQQPRAD